MVVFDGSFRSNSGRVCVQLVMRCLIKNEVVLVILLLDRVPFEIVFEL